MVTSNHGEIKAILFKNKKLVSQYEWIRLHEKQTSV
jgi:hypothetical protein